MPICNALKCFLCCFPTSQAMIALSKDFCELSQPSTQTMCSLLESLLPHPTLLFSRVLFILKSTPLLGHQGCFVTLWTLCTFYKELKMSLQFYLVHYTLWDDHLIQCSVLCFRSVQQSTHIFTVHHLDHYHLWTTVQTALVHYWDFFHSLYLQVLV